MTTPRLAFYGDDFSGSADVMEVLTWAGLRTRLFLEPPSPARLAAENLDAFGVAGVSRTMSPDEMERELRPILSRLKESGAPFVHYKVCSTFDSSPEIGSIGRALELGRGVFGGQVVPIVVAAPNLGRYQAFGNLFARSGLDSKPFRLDRHPTMKHHPITPMTESDLRVHLAEQTGLRVGLVDVLRLNEIPAGGWKDFPLPEGDAVLFDVLYPEHLPRVGEALQSLVETHSPRFVVGSSGIEYALTEYWSERGHLSLTKTRKPQFGGCRQLLVLTGSCSPVNDRQIAWAEEFGFETIALHPAKLISPQTSEQEIASTVERALDRIRRGVNLILHSSRGPDDPRGAEMQRALQSLGFRPEDIKRKSGATLGPKLGQILKRILQERKLERVGVAGGDTSGYVGRELGIEALEAVAPVAPGSPLCRVHAQNQLDGLEIIFKGGQVGKDDVWGTLRTGTRPL